jgi:hypothetical protein
MNQWVYEDHGTVFAKGRTGDEEYSKVWEVSTGPVLLLTVLAAAEQIVADPVVTLPAIAIVTAGVLYDEMNLHHDGSAMVDDLAISDVQVGLKKM